MVLIDLSSGALKDAERRLISGFSDLPTLDFVRADALSLPVRPRSATVVALLGNVLGFSDRDADEVLREASACLSPKGVLLLETYTPAARGPVLPPLRPLSAWKDLLAREPSAGWSSLASGPWRVRPARKVSPSFSSWSAARVIRRLRSEGLQVRDRMVAAPLTGDSPELVEGLIRRGRLSLAELVALENAAGRDRRIVAAGGTVLWAASSGSPGQVLPDEAWAST